MTLAWVPSTGTDVVGYNLYYGPGSRNYTNIVAAGNVTNVTVSGLVPGAAYYFAATAYTSAGLESDYSTEIAFTNSVVVQGNQPPTLDPLGNVTIMEGAGQQTVNLSGITSGASNEVQTLTVSATSSATGLIPNPTVNYSSPNTTGTLTFTPVAFAFGTATITVTVNDGGASNNLVTRTFTVTVNPVNQAPTLNAIGNLTINEGVGLQTVNLAGITSGASNEVQTLTVSATSSATGLIPNPTVNYTSPNTTGSLTFTPVPLMSGTATITVTVNDGGASNNLVTRTFTVTVNPVNQAPTLNAISDLTINENAGPQTVNLSGITSGASNEVQTLTVTATSSGQGTVPNPTVNYTSPNATGTLILAPAALAFGTVTITVTVNDGGASNNVVSRTFNVRVNPVNQQPTLTAPADVAVNANSGLQTVPLSGITSGASNEVQTLTVAATSGNLSVVPNPAVQYTSPATTGSLTFTPVHNAVGSAVITVTVNDGGASNNLVTRTFNVTVNAIHNGPALVAQADRVVNALSLLTVTNTAVDNDVPARTLTYALVNPPAGAAISANGVITWTPSLAQQPSTNTLTTVVRDDGTPQLSATNHFAVIVSAVPVTNAPPTLNPLGDLTINQNAGQQTVNLTGISSGVTNGTATLSITASSSVPGLIPNPTVSYLNPSTTGTLTFAPAAGGLGSATITVTLNNGQAENNILVRTFNVSVTPVSSGGSCVGDLTMSPLSFTANAGAGTFLVAAGSNCAWSVTAPSWVMLSSTNGAGSTSGSFTVDGNPGAARSTSLLFTCGTNTLSLTVTQQAVLAGAVALLSPPDNLSLQDRSPRFSWTQSQPAGTWFYLQVLRNGSTYLALWLQGTTNWTATNDLPAGSYSWSVQPWSPAGYGTWSTASTFVIPLQMPGTVDPITPSVSANSSAVQRYTWTADPAATWYELIIDRNGAAFLDKWFALSNSVIDPATGDFAVDVSGHGMGAYQWRVRAWSPDGYGPWSTETAFNIGAVTLLTPTNNASFLTGRPQLAWSQSDPTATWFYLWLNRDGSKYLDLWLEGATATNWAPAADLPAGTYTWWVETWNSSGYGPWSQAGTFTVQVPGAITLVSPAANVAPAASQRYTWQADSLASWYELAIDKDGQSFFDQWFTLSNSVVNPATGQFAVDVSQRAMGTYQWRVRGWNSSGYGQWSGSQTFTEGATTLLAPAGTATSASPVFTWSAVSGVTWYQVWIGRNGAFYNSTWVEGANTWTPTSSLPQAGQYEWWVQTWNSDGYGPWSGPAYFTVPQP